jgi:hypothetical protein
MCEANHRKILFAQQINQALFLADFTRNRQFETGCTSWRVVTSNSPSMGIRTNGFE